MWTTTSNYELCGVGWHKECGLIIGVRKMFAWSANICFSSMYHVLCTIHIVWVHNITCVCLLGIYLNIFPLNGYMYICNITLYTNRYRDWHAIKSKRPWIDLRVLFSYVDNIIDFKLQSRAFIDSIGKVTYLSIIYINWNLPLI